VQPDVVCQPLGLLASHLIHFPTTFVNGKVRGVADTLCPQCREVVYVGGRLYQCDGALLSAALELVRSINVEGRLVADVWLVISAEHNKGKQLESTQT
jgi:hypothetical protein